MRLIRSRYVSAYCSTYIGLPEPPAWTLPERSVFFLSLLALCIFVKQAEACSHLIVSSGRAMCVENPLHTRHHIYNRPREGPARTAGSFSICGDRKKIFISFFICHIIYEALKTRFQYMRCWNALPIHGCAEARFRIWSRWNGNETRLTGAWVEWHAHVSS